MNPTGLLFFAFGALLMAGAFLNWEWFMNNYKSRRLVKIIGRNGARIFYGLIGLALAVVGTLLTLGLVGAP